MMSKYFFWRFYHVNYLLSVQTKGNILFPIMMQTMILHAWGYLEIILFARIPVVLFIR